MPPAIRHTDICKGHGCWGPRPNIEGSPDVFINRLGAHRVGDAWAAHCCGPDCHGSTAMQGSPNVFVNGRPLCREDDLTYCGSPVGATKSPDVFVNDLG